MTQTAQSETKSQPNEVPSHRVLGKGAQNAENIAYTINHALACTTTDLIDPVVSNWSVKYLKQRISIGCGHDHSQDGPVWWHSTVGELAGDFGAVPVTVFVQRYMPWLMDGIRYVAEPIMGDLFRRGAKAATDQKLHESMMKGYPLSKEAYQEHVRELYRYEVQHLPQGLFWTAFAAAANVGIQKKVLNSKEDVNHLWAGKITGSIISAALLFGFRSAATEKANKWDQWSTRNVFLPATKKIGHLFGVKEEDVQNLVDKQDKLNAPNWTERASKETPKNQMVIG